MKQSWSRRKRTETSREKGNLGGGYSCLYRPTVQKLSQ